MKSGLNFEINTFNLIIDVSIGEVAQLKRNNVFFFKYESFLTEDWGITAWLKLVLYVKRNRKKVWKSSKEMKNEWKAD